jgi:TPR repeat protein
MYANGWGMPQDYVEAHKWLNLAATGFPASEPEKREMAVRNRDQLAARMTAAQIAEAQRLARAWKPNTTRASPNASP